VSPISDGYHPERNLPQKRPWGGKKKSLSETALGPRRSRKEGESGQRSAMLFTPKGGRVLRHQPCQCKELSCRSRQGRKRSEKGKTAGRVMRRKSTKRGEEEWGAVPEPRPREWKSRRIKNELFTKKEITMGQRGTGPRT